MLPNPLSAASHKMPDPKDKPHYLGDRDRLRERFRAAGGDGMPDYEILELLLYQAIPRRGAKPIVKDLLDSFGAALRAPVDALQQQVKGIGEAAATALKVSHATGLRLA